MLKNFTLIYLEQIEAINSRTYKTKWDHFDIGMVFVSHVVEGFSLINNGKEKIDIIRIMVDRRFRNKGIGTILLKNILFRGKPMEIVLNENDKEGILWMRKKLFFGIGIERGYFGRADGWVFRRNK